MSKAIEAAARALWENGSSANPRPWDEASSGLRDRYRMFAAAALTAATPFIQAEVLRDAADEFRNCPDWGYRASRPMATENYLRARANEIEATA